MAWWKERDPDRKVKVNTNFKKTIKNNNFIDVQFKVYNSVVFSIIAEWGSQHHSQFHNISLTPKETLYSWTVTLLSPASQSRATSQLLFVSLGLPI